MTSDNLGEALIRLHNLRQMVKETHDAIDMLSLEIIQQLEGSGASVYEDSKVKASIPVKREYMPDKFLAVMGERLSPEQLNEVYSPAHEVTKTVPAKVNGVKAQKLWKQGDETVAALETTLLPPKRSLKIELRNEEQAL